MQFQKKDRVVVSSKAQAFSLYGKPVSGTVINAGQDKCLVKADGFYSLRAVPEKHLSVLDSAQSHKRQLA